MKSWIWSSILGVLAAPPLLAVSTPPAQTDAIVAEGEVLTYRARIGSVASGTGTMRVVGRETVRGHETLVLHFDFTGRAGPVRMGGRMRSWLDPATMAVHRFLKEERSPLGTSTEAVELFPSRGIWRSADGAEHAAATPLPLDELSFLYYVRTLPLAEPGSSQIVRHFDPERNPVTITLIGRQQLEVPAGTFDVIVVEMVVPNGQHVRAGSAIRLFLTDDGLRIPVRIESSVRVLGRVVFTLENCNRHTGASR